MIDGFLFALQVAGVAVLIGWALLHDRLEEGAVTRGPLAFKPDDRHPGEQGRERREHHGLTRRRRRVKVDSDGTER